MSNSEADIKAYVKYLVDEAKRKHRAIKALWDLQNKIGALPKVQSIYLNNNYVNPVTLNFPPKKVIVYKVQNKNTKRINYYDSKTFWKLVGHSKNNYKLLTFDPKKTIMTNPVTRNPFRARNITRVRVKGTKNNAARKIQSAVRKHLKKKKVNKK
jgi:hypothetical protein